MTLNSPAAIVFVLGLSFYLNCVVSDTFQFKSDKLNPRINILN